MKGIRYPVGNQVTEGDQTPADRPDTRKGITFQEKDQIPRWGQDKKMMGTFPNIFCGGNM